MQSHASAAAQHELATEHGVHAGDTDEALAMALPRSLANQHAKRRPLAVVEDNVTVRGGSMVRATGQPAIYVIA